MKDLMKMIMKKKAGAEEMSPDEIQAKMDVIQELLDLANQSQGKGIAGKLQKVSVMAPDKDKLMEGMDKAKELVEESPEAMLGSEESEDESEECEMEASPLMAPEAEEDDESEGMSFEERRRRKMKRMEEE